jgi:hypothetical protein
LGFEFWVLSGFSFELADLGRAKGIANAGDILIVLNERRHILTEIKLAQKGVRTLLYTKHNIAKRRTPCDI